MTILPDPTQERLLDVIRRLSSEQKEQVITFAEALSSETLDTLGAMRERARAVAFPKEDLAEILAYVLEERVVRGDELDVPDLDS